MKRLLCLVGALLFACGPNWIVPECTCGADNDPGIGIQPPVILPDPDLDGGTPPEEPDSGTPPEEPTSDAGTPEEPTPDAGTPEEPTPDAGTPECLPGYGLGDDNHCHSGPPGQEEAPTECKPGYGWGDDNHCHLKSCDKLKEKKDKKS